MQIKVKAHTDENKESLEKIGPAKFECFLKEKPQNNAANKKLISLLSDHFNLPKNSIKIIKGHHSPSKIILIDHSS